jgi:hypothetical protein
MKPAVTAVLLLLTFSAIISTGKTKIASSFYIIFYTHNQTVSLHQVNRSKCMTTRKCFHPPSNDDRINFKKGIVFFFFLIAEARPNGKGVWNAVLRQARDDECGPASGQSCASGLCCSLYNECGTSVAHCNVSLGCKNKWGECH